MPALPATLGDFRLLAILGEGATGTVYEAEWGPRRVALKIMQRARLADPLHRERFLAEARLLGAMAHPSVVKVLGSGELDDGRAYLVMELLRGETLAAQLERGAAKVGRAREIVAQIASAVAALHEAGLVHRDVKPENVFLVAGARHAVLLDVGIARAIDDPGATLPGDVVGTPAYMAPERCLGQPASVASDVYELALLFYVAVCGRLPWGAGGDPTARLAPPSPASLGVSLPSEVEACLLRALSPRPGDRPASVLELARGLDLDLDLDVTVGGDFGDVRDGVHDDARDDVRGDVHDDAGDGGEPASGEGRRRRWLAAGAVAIALAALASTAVVLASRDGDGDGDDDAITAPEVSEAVRHRTACDEGSADDCFALAKIFDQGEGWIEDEELAIESYHRACRAGSGAGCAEVGQRLLDGRGAEVDRALAARYLERACGRSQAASCARVALMYAAGDGVDRDPRAAARLHRRACDGGAVESCVSLGVALSKGEGLEADETAAAVLFGRACDEGDATGCFDLGYAHDHGKGVEKDPVRAAKLYRQACDGGSGGGCTNLGVMHDNGGAVEVDDLRAAALYQRGCDLGSAVGCANLALMFQRGEGIVADPARAERLGERACELSGGAHGCNNLGVGLAARGELSRAAELYRRACDAGVALACGNLARAHDEGKGVARDRARARELWALACKLGDERGCTR